VKLHQSESDCDSDSYKVNLVSTINQVKVKGKSLIVYPRQKNTYNNNQSLGNQCASQGDDIETEVSEDY
jgi:hypothetical protein